MTIATRAQTFETGTRSSLDDLQSRIAGDLITVGHAEFHESRKMVNVTYDHYPLAIVRAAVQNDVVETVRFARANGIPMSVRSGGHSVSGQSVVNGAIVLDLSQLKNVSIDPAALTARVQPGARTRDIMVPAHAYGLALTTGDTASVGIGGLATGGGIGWMVRKHGLTIDSLVSAQVITADGDEITASATENSDLFWAIRGGGGNFGVITEFEFRLAQVGQVLGGVLMLPATREVIRSYLEYASNAPDDLTTITNLMHAPPAPFVPEHRIGELTLAVIVVWTGSIEEGERVMAPLRALGEAIADTVAPIPYPVIYEYTAEAENPYNGEVRSMFHDDLSDDSIDAILDAMHAARSPMAMVQFRALGGAMARVGCDETAFAHRDARFLTLLLGMWEDPAEDGAPHREWTLDLWEKIRSEGNGVYVNFLAQEGEARVRDAYPAATLERLARVKAKYDPDNFFRFNQNVRPQS